MRVLAVLLLLAACEHRPPPKQDRAASAPATPAPTGGSAAAAPPDAAAPLPPDAFDVTMPCLEVSAHIAETMIKEAKDPTQRAALEQEKTKLIRRAAEGCTRDAWPASAIECFTKAQTVDAMTVCGKDLKAP